ncbi:MAG TPA: ATP-binding cassette domain-containing protein [Brachybacterium sp.]
MTQHAAGLDNLTVQRTGFAIHDLSFTLPRGTMLGLVAPNGAEKTTTIRALLGLCAPDNGTVELLGA